MLDYDEEEEYTDWKDTPIDQMRKKLQEERQQARLEAKQGKVRQNGHKKPDDTERAMLEAAVNAELEAETPIKTTSGHTFKRSSIINLNDVEETLVDWLVYPYFQRGAATSVEGEADIGKSLVLEDFIARFTANKPFPDGLIRKFDGAQGVVFITYEDDVAQSVKPRIAKAGGNLELVRVIRWVEDEGALGKRGLDLTLVTDRELLEIAMDEVKASIVFIDPIISALGNIDINQTGDVRNALLPLLEIMERRKANMTSLRHFRKSNEGGFKQKGIGSMAFQEMARAGLAFTFDNEDETDATRLVTLFKHNNSPGMKSLKYTIEGGIDIVPQVKWLGMSDKTERQILEQGKPGTAMHQDILNYMKEQQGGALKAGDIATAMESKGYDRAQVYTNLRRLYKAKKLDQPIDGVYQYPLTK